MHLYASFMQIPDVSGYEPGQVLEVENLFKVGDLIDVAGQSIGKGFQGADRLNFLCNILYAVHLYFIWYKHNCA